MIRCPECYGQIIVERNPSAEDRQTILYTCLQCARDYTPTSPQDALLAALRTNVAAHRPRRGRPPKVRAS